jgi:hypothetical protein
MSKVLSLALKINADSSGLKLDPVERALKRLGDETDKVTKVFDKFAGTSEVAARAQEQTAKALEDLTKARQAGTISAEEFAREFERVSEAANQEAAALERAARVTQANLTPTERFSQAQKELKQDLDAGRISQETYARAVEGAAKGLTDAERAAAGLGAAQKQIADSAASTTLKFNELSGIFAVLPGPLGNIAGRISGISSAAQGLSRIFSGGLLTGIRNIAASFTLLINPLTASLAGITAFAAASTAIASGLIALEDRVEKLGNTANKLGVSFQFVQVLDESARRSGTSIDAVSAAFGRLQKSVLGVDEESKAAQKALAELGVTAEELAALAPEEQYQRIGRALAGIEDPARRTATATALFGRAGADLIPFFNNIKGATDDLSRFGAVLSDIQKRNIDEFGNSMDRLGVATRTASDQLLAEFAPAASRTADAAAVALSAVANNADAIESAISTTILGTLDRLTGGLVTAVNLTSRAIDTFSGSSEKASLAAGGTANAIARSAAEIGALNAAFGNSQRGLDAIIAKAAEFGQAGFDAAFEFKQALDELAEQALEDGLNAEQYARGVGNATREFEKQIDVIRQVAAENKRLADDAQREAEAIERRADQLLEKAEGIPQIRRDLEAVEEEIFRVETALADARRSGAEEQAKALEDRLNKLNELSDNFSRLAQESDQGFEDGINAATSAAFKQLESLRRKRLELFGEEGREADVALFSQIAQARAQALEGETRADFDERIRQATKIFEREVKNLERLAKIREDIANQEQAIRERTLEIELERAEELASIRTGSVEIKDLRSGGISAFFDTLKEDPAIAEAKKQTKELEKIRGELAKLQAEKVEILAGTG